MFPVWSVVVRTVTVTSDGGDISDIVVRCHHNHGYSDDEKRVDTISNVMNATMHDYVERRNQSLSISNYVWVCRRFGGCFPCW